MAGLLVIGALVLPVARDTLVDRATKAPFQTSSFWLTARYETTTASQLGQPQPGRHKHGTIDWTSWPLSILAILALLAAAVIIVSRRGTWTSAVVGAMVFSLCWTSFPLIGPMSGRNTDPGAGLVETVHLGGGWWFLLASDVLVVAALAMLGLAHRRPPRNGLGSAPALPAAATGVPLSG